MRTPSYPCLDPGLALAFFVAALCLTPLQAELKVAALHPILGDLARQIGGASVNVVDLLRPGGDVHHFEPTALTLGEASGTQLVLACGKNMEGYLGKLRDNLGRDVKIIEVGKTLPSLAAAPDGDSHDADHDHDHGGLDPHWWHSVENMQRAARIVAKAFGEADPGNMTTYLANAAAAQQEFAALKSWAEHQLAQIPRADRKLVTGHAAFGYFCKEFGFQAIPVLGLAREDTASARHIVETIKVIRENKVRAVFPEDQANPKVLLEITRETGAKAGRPLVADGTSVNAHTFETMLRHNVESIVAALKP